jgi:hypothetical protein
MLVEGKAMEIASKEQNDKPQEPARAAPVINDTTTHKSKKIALADDDKSTCELAAEKLSQIKCSDCSLRPHRECAFFVAWNGVIVLVYEGFPLSLVNAKKCIQESVPNLKPENFGSKWPKTTLGALQDDADDFTVEELQTLCDICAKFSNSMLSAKVEIPVRTLSMVKYNCRSLERIWDRKDVSLELATVGDSSFVSREEMATVDGVVGEWCDLSSYLPKVNAPGSRIGSYRSACRGGATCVAFLDPLPEALRQPMNDFQSTVEHSFPGRYIWMEESSLHCTLRSLSPPAR